MTFYIGLKLTDFVGLEFAAPRAAESVDAAADGAVRADHYQLVAV